MLPPQAIDLLDEAGSRVRIAAYAALREQGRGAAEMAATSYQDLAQIMDAKDEAVQVRLVLGHQLELEVWSFKRRVPWGSGGVVLAGGLYVGDRPVAGCLGAWAWQGGGAWPWGQQWNERDRLNP